MLVKVIRNYGESIKVDIWKIIMLTLITLNKCRWSNFRWLGSPVGDFNVRKFDHQSVTLTFAIFGGLDHQWVTLPSQFRSPIGDRNRTRFPQWQCELIAVLKVLTKALLPSTKRFFWINLIFYSRAKSARNSYLQRQLPRLQRRICNEAVGLVLCGSCVLIIGGNRHRSYNR